MARGLTQAFKQPIYVGFDQKMSKAILLDIITKLHEIGYTVVAVTSDCGSSNVGVWKEMNVDHNNPAFLHPVTQEEIVFMADVPHLLKLLRNWLLDTGFVLQNGEKISKSPLEALLKLKDNSEVTAAHKLTELHLTCQRAQRQNVRLAAQLISHTTATALLR